MADLRDAQFFITYVQMMQALDAEERRDLFCEQKRWLNAREKSVRTAVDCKGGSLEPHEFSEAFRKITEERLWSFTNPSSTVGRLSISCAEEDFTGM